MLAYVFWHVPATPGRDYERALAGFHAALRADPPAGLTSAESFALDAIPWLDGAAGYEDWYVVDGFEALGRLNEAAVSGSRRAPHDAAAARARTGVAGLMAPVAGVPLPAEPAWAAWAAKPAGLPYEEAHRELAAAVAGRDAGAWQRQMTLGPATEYCVLAADEVPLPWPAAHAWTVRRVPPA